MALRNKVVIKEENENLYLTLKSIADPIGRNVLLIFNLLLTAVIIGILLLVGLSDPVIVIPALFISTFIGLMWKYWLWNAGGCEELLITETTLVSYFDYKLFRTNPRYLISESWRISFEKQKTVKGVTIGHLVFLERESVTQITYPAYRSSMLLPEEEYEKAKAAIERYRMRQLLQLDRTQLN